MAYTDPLAGLLPGTTSQGDPDSIGAGGSVGVAGGTGTGRYGFALADFGGGAGRMIGSAVTDVWTFLNRPFRVPLSSVDVFLLVGAVLVAILLWNLILFHLRIAAETI